jgi:precorrin-3B synthase
MVPIALGHRRTGLCPTFAHPTLQRDGYLLRVPLVGGHLLVHQVEALAHVAGDYGNGIVELTNRGNLQLRGLAQDTLGLALAACQAVGLGDYSASLVTISPLAAAGERRLREVLVRSLADVDAERLSRKFAVHIDDKAGHTADRPADLLVRLTDADAYEVTVRTLGSTTCASAEEVAGLARRLAETCIQHGPHARPADVASSTGPAALAAAIGAARAWLPSPLPRHARPPLQIGIAPWPHTLAEPQPNGAGVAGADYLTRAAARFGRVNAATMAGLGGLLRRHQLDSLTITPWRSFAFACSSADHAAAVLEDAAALGLLTDTRDPAFGVITCIGSAGCWQTELDTLAEAERFVAARAQPPIQPASPGARAGLGSHFGHAGLGSHGGHTALEPGALVHVSGCDKLCATRAPVTLTLLGRTDQSGFDTLAPPRP